MTVTTSGMSRFRGSLTRRDRRSLAGMIGFVVLLHVAGFGILFGFVLPNHYALGMIANGMSVWDVDDAEASALGARVGALTFVSHCYLRPRARPLWPYNLFAMLHGGTRAEVEEKRAEVAAMLGTACAASDILYSTRILKKTGLRLRDAG